jgi:5-oxopent-3-ene-1,2,5-tricarboxylate decarboxylase/2-hydroxyhepta-2,4-diene-1,7-dioate isomerase
LVQTSSTADLIRPAARLLADVTEFMTLSPGTCWQSAPLRRRRVFAPATLRIESDGLGSHCNPFLDAAA